MTELTEKELLLELVNIQLAIEAAKKGLRGGFPMHAVGDLRAAHHHLTMAINRITWIEDREHWLPWTGHRINLGN